MNPKTSSTQLITLLISLLLISCNGQYKSNPSAEPTPPVDTTPEVKAPYVDPLFFIDGQLCQHVRRIFQDSRGDLWFGTNVYGLMHYNGDSLEYSSGYDSLGNGRITGIVEDKDGNLWFGAYGGLTKYDPKEKSFTNYAEEDGLIHHEIWSVILDSKGLFWIGTSEGVSTFDGQTFTNFDLPQPDIENKSYVMSPNRVSSILEDQKGNYWFGTDGYGLCKYDGKTFTLFTKQNGLCDHNIMALHEDPRGDIWIGSMFGGLSKYDGTSFTNFSQNGEVDGVEVSSFYEDKKGNLWFPVENHGVYRYDPAAQTFTNLDKKEKLATNGILCMMEDKEGRFWFGGWGGLFHFDGHIFTSVTKDGPWD